MTDVQGALLAPQLPPEVGGGRHRSVDLREVPSERGYDAGKKVKGHKRHLLVDTLGLMMAVVVTTASVQDRWIVERTLG